MSVRMCQAGIGVRGTQKPIDACLQHFQRVASTSDIRIGQSRIFSGDDLIKAVIIYAKLVEQR